jgi:hypothetical protein
MKWIDEIAYDFVMDMYKKSTQDTEFKKAQEVFDIINKTSPESLAKMMNISEKDWNIGSAWRYASDSAYRLMWKFY